MNNEISQLQNQVDDLTRRVDELTKSNTIPYNIESALRTRLGIGDVSYIVGSVTLASGTYTITDSRIKSTSTILVTNQYSNITTGAASSNTLAAACSSGSATIFIGGGISSDLINYMIIF